MAASPNASQSGEGKKTLSEPTVRRILEPLSWIWGLLVFGHKNAKRVLYFDVDAGRIEETRMWQNVDISALWAPQMVHALSDIGHKRKYAKGEGKKSIDDGLSIFVCRTVIFEIPLDWAC